MFNKKTSYEVNVQDITFWRKKINVDNTEVFVRECLNDPFMLYLDKVKGDNYLDWVTGRPFIMEDFGKDFLLSLSNIKISKENVTICDDAVGKALYYLKIMIEKRNILIYQKVLFMIVIFAILFLLSMV